MKPIYSGKVREIYDLSDQRLVIVTTDRISAFDHILPATVPGKGVLLNRLSNFWFEKTRDIVPNHIVECRTEKMPAFFHDPWFSGRTVLAEKLKMLPFEFVVRGYLFGSLWETCRNGTPFCGARLSGQRQLAQKLEQPILTPAIKRDTGHDEYVALSFVEDRLGKAVTRQIEEICQKLYERCAGYAQSKGLILADAKFEFGRRPDGQLVLADELFTPDSSRYWDGAGYQPGKTPPSFDKQFLRDWLTSHQTEEGLPFDRVPEEILLQTAQRYQECVQRLVDPA